jgi:hypothetical protein
MTPERKASLAAKKEKRLRLVGAIMGMTKADRSKALEIILIAMSDQQLVRAANLLLKKMAK